MSEQEPARRYPFSRLICLVVALLCTEPAWAQLTVGDNLSMNLSGNLGVGYSGSTGSEQGSSAHGQTLVGNGVLTGSYYNPNFVNFQVRPFWDRNQSNSTSAILTHENGLDSSVALFGGSAFPGSISFGKMFSGLSQSALPGQAGVETSGSSQSFGVTWAEHLDGLPPVSVNYSSGSSSYNVLGSGGNNDSATKNLDINTNYDVLGFNTAATFNHSVWNYKYSDLLGLNASSDGSSTGYSFSAQHPIPRGGVGLSYSHNSYDNNSGSGFSGSSNSLNANGTYTPIYRLSFSGQMQYTTNLYAALLQSLLPSGGYAFINSQSSSNALSTGGSASLNVGHGLSLVGYGNRVSTDFEGRTVNSTQYGGTASYRFTNNSLRSFHFSVGLIDIANKEGNGGLALVGAAGFDRKISHWETSADFMYSQDVQTLYGLGVTSRYTYGGSVRRKFNETTFWSSSVRANHSGLSNGSGGNSAGESMSSSLTWRRYTFGGNYSQSRGLSIVSASGIVTPITGIDLLTGNTILVNGKTYSITGSAALTKRLYVSGSYTHGQSDLTSYGDYSFNRSKYLNTRFDYRMRKLFISGGYSRTNQEATTIKNPFVLNSYYVSLSRWFNVF